MPSSRCCSPPGAARARALLARAPSAAAFATARHSAADRRGGLRLCAGRGASLAPCSSARSLARGRNGPTAARRRVAAARRSSRRRSRALLAPARSAAAFATARHSAAARRGGLRLCAGRGASLAPCSSARSLARGRDGSTAARRRVTAARRSSRRRSRALLAPARSAAAFATARHSAAARRGGLRLCAGRGASLAPCSSAQSLARGRDGSTAARRRVTAARRSSRRRSRALLAPARSAAAFATARHSAAARRGGLRLCAGRGASLAPCSSARSRPWPQRLDGRPPSSRCCSPPGAARSRALLARARSAAAFATALHSAAARRGGLRLRAGRGASLAPCSSARSLARGRDGSTAARRRVTAARRSSRRRSRALLARSVGRRARDGTTLGRRSVRRSTPPALNAARLLRRSPLRGHSPVAATARRPFAVESLLLAAWRGALARAARARSVGRRFRDGPTLGRRSTRRSSPLRWTRRISCAVLLCAVTRPWPRRLDGRPPSSRCCSPPGAAHSHALLARARSAAAFATALHSAAARRGGLRLCAGRGASLAPCSSARSLARGRNGPTAARRRVAAAHRSSRRRSRTLLAPARSAAAFATSHAVAATARRPPAVESLLLAARRGDARARRSRPLGRPPLSRRPDTRPPLDAAAFACAERGAFLAPCSSARSHARGRVDSSAACRQVAAARRSSRRRSRPLLAPARPAAAFATARNLAAARRGGLRLRAGRRRALAASAPRAVTRASPAPRAAPPPRQRVTARVAARRRRAAQPAAASHSPPARAPTAAARCAARPRDAARSCAVSLRAPTAPRTSDAPSAHRTRAVARTRTRAAASRDAADSPAHRRLTLASGSRAHRTAQCVAHNAHNTLRATLRAQHFRASARHLAPAQPHRDDAPRRSGQLSPPPPRARLRPTCRPRRTLRNTRRTQHFARHASHATQCALRSTHTHPTAP